MTRSYTTRLTKEHKEFLQQTFPDAVNFDAKTLRVYASDASLVLGQILAMVRPTYVEQVQKLLKWASDEGIPIHPRGRGTGLSGGCVPTTAGIVVSMLGMDKVLEISKEDFVAIVEPGVNTADFQAQCAKRGLFYPPDPASGKATSLGGNAATCAGGLRAVKYGVTRDYVLGLEAVLPDGQLLKLGGRTHKDVIGLDLTRFFVGSEGSLGIITKLILKLLPKPEASASVLVGYPSLEAAFTSMQKVFAAGILPCAVEFMNETVLDILAQTGDIFWPDDIKALMLFQVDGSKDTVPLENARLAKQLNDASWKMEGVGVEEDKLWSVRRRISAGAYVLGPDRIGGDMAVPRGALLTAIRRFEDLAKQHGKRLIAFGHAGDGNIHANLHYDATDPDDTERTMKVHHALDAAALEFGGSISGEHGAGCLKAVEKQLGKAEHGMMLAIRKLFDPKAILNPNKGY